jgi:hypothetical protein
LFFKIRKGLAESISLAETVKELDGMIFRSRPGEVYIVEDRKMCENKVIFYLPEYFSYIICQKEFKKNFNEYKRSLLKAYPYNEEREIEKAVIVGIASHEVRHRVQREFKVHLFSPENAKILIPASRVETILKITKNSDREFDAACIELITVGLWLGGENNLSRIAEIVREDCQKIIKRVTPSFYFIFIYSIIFFQTQHSSLDSNSYFVNIIYSRYEFWTKTKKIKNREGFNSAGVG